MTSPDRQIGRPPARKPTDEELDVYGLTHPGKVRTTNQDHFLICSLASRCWCTSPVSRGLEPMPVLAERLAFLAVVADGVGGSAGGETASRLAVEAVTRYVAESMQCYYCLAGESDDAFLASLQDAAVQCHDDLLDSADDAARARGHGHDAHALARRLAARLPAAGGRQPLLPAARRRAHPALPRPDHGPGAGRRGRLARAEASRTRWAHTLSSAIGGRQTAPIVTRLDQEWGNVGLLCSDGLTRHVSDDRIRDRLRRR